MGCVFTTIFEFNVEQQAAMFRLHEEQGGQTSFQVQLFNKDLYNLVPEGKFDYSTGDGNLDPAINYPETTELIRLVKKAVNEYLIAGPTATVNKVMPNSSRDTNSNTPPQ